MNIGEHLLAVGMPDRDGSNPPHRSSPGPPDAGRPSAPRRAFPRDRAEDSEHDQVVPRRREPQTACPGGPRGQRLPRPRFSPRARSWSPISRLAVRIEGAMIEVSAIRFNANSSAERSATAARQAEATSTPSNGPSDVRSQRRVHFSRVSGSWTSPRAIAVSSPPRMGVAADRQGRIGDLKQAETHQTILFLFSICEANPNL